MTPYRSSKMQVFQEDLGFSIDMFFYHQQYGTPRDMRVETTFGLLGRFYLAYGDSILAVRKRKFKRTQFKRETAALRGF
ncbi:MAG: hypothetical protein WAM39_09850 [Bryobacteraceae bacterium]